MAGMVVMAERTVKAAFDLVYKMAVMALLTILNWLKGMKGLLVLCQSLS